MLQELRGAFRCFRKARAKNEEAVLALAEEALPLYGNEDPMYMGQVVNYYLQAQQRYAPSKSLAL